MSKTDFTKYLSTKIAELKTEGLYKAERIITSQQQAEIEVNNHHVFRFGE
jgi:glycine C-acetyltransferase